MVMHEKLLNIFELIVNAEAKSKVIIDDALVKRHSQQVIATYDKGGEATL